MKIGDVFTWSWNKDTEKDMAASFQSGTAYWCMDMWCVAVEHPKKEKGIILIDTYNYNQYRRGDGEFTYDSLYSQYMKVIDPSKVDINYKGNLNDFEPCDKYTIDDYEVEDTLIIPSYAGYHKVFLKKKGAQESKRKLIENLENDIAKYQREIESNKRRIERAARELEELV